MSCVFPSHIIARRVVGGCCPAAGTAHSAIHSLKVVLVQRGPLDVTLPWMFGCTCTDVMLRAFSIGQGRRRWCICTHLKENIKVTRLFTPPIDPGHNCKYAVPDEQAPWQGPSAVADAIRASIIASDLTISSQLATQLVSPNKIKQSAESCFGTRHTASLEHLVCAIDCEHTMT